MISGELPADVVTLGLATNIDALRKRGLVAENWADRLPNKSIPYTSTVVFVVRKGNPHSIHDGPIFWLRNWRLSRRTRERPEWQTCRTRRLGCDHHAGGMKPRPSPIFARFRHVPVLDEGARGAAIRFSVQESGDVHLSWENEALREVAESNGKLEIVYPPVEHLLAEPCVTWVDSAVEKNGNALAAKAYLTFLFSDVAQETIARLGYRPSKAGIAERAGVRFPRISLVPLTAIARDLNEVNEKFFAENGIVDAVMALRDQ